MGSIPSCECCGVQMTWDTDCWRCERCNTAVRYRARWRRPVSVPGPTLRT